jgi:hypothetical protein
MIKKMFVALVLASVAIVGAVAAPSAAFATCPHHKCHTP